MWEREGEGGKERVGGRGWEGEGGERGECGGIVSQGDGEMGRWGEGERVKV